MEPGTARRRRHGRQRTRREKNLILPILGILTHKSCACSMIAFSTTSSVGDNSGCLGDLNHLIKVLTRPTCHTETRILKYKVRKHGHDWAILAPGRLFRDRKVNERSSWFAHPRIFQSDDHFTSMSGVPGTATNRSGGHALSQGVTRVCFL